MDPLDAVQVAIELLRGNTENAIFFVTGAATVVSIWLFVAQVYRRRARKGSEYYRALYEQSLTSLAPQTLELDELHRKQGKAEKEKNALEEASQTANQHIHEREEGQRDLFQRYPSVWQEGESKLAQLAHQRAISKIESDRVQKVPDQSPGEIVGTWTIPKTQMEMWGRSAKQPAPFIPKSERTCRIISLVNLKGGVGKTTLTANLGVALGCRGRRVLLVDLDYQGTLSGLCLPQSDRIHVTNFRRTVAELFRSATPNLDVLNKLKVSVGFAPQEAAARGSFFLLAADESLGEVEGEAYALLQCGERDPRYCFRQVFHHSDFSNHFDHVLIDCPPRWTAPAVAALAASDYVLIPVIPDPPSAEAVPRLLQWLSKFKVSAQICPQIELLGVVANKVSMYGRDLIISQRNVLEELEAQCRDRWGGPVYFFRSKIKLSNEFGRIARRPGFAALSGKLQMTFRDLAAEFEAKIKGHNP